MAIKISGTTVIDDSQNLCNAGTITANNFIGDGSQLTNAGPARIIKPTNTSPATNATGVTTTPTLCASEYFSLYGISHANSQFQVSIDSGFSNTEVDVFTGAVTELTVPSALNASTQHFFRVRYFDECGTCSQFSDATCFTVGTPLQDLGFPSCGGFYMGAICAAGSCYYLIMAPNSTGCAACIWRTAYFCSATTGENFDGYGNTYDSLANPSCCAVHPAGNWTATRSIGGFSDWYLPALCELEQLCINRACAPAGEGFPTARYWSSTECNATFVFSFVVVNGSFDALADKLDANKVRAIRREPFPS